jgi:hypothetical protein
MRDNSNSNSATYLAAASRSDPKARAMMSILATVTPSIGNGPDKPCLKALRLELNRPVSLFGPVLSLAWRDWLRSVLQWPSNSSPTSHACSLPEMRSYFPPGQELASF